MRSSYLVLVRHQWVIRLGGHFYMSGHHIGFVHLYQCDVTSRDLKWDVDVFIRVPKVGYTVGICTCSVLQMIWMKQKRLIVGHYSHSSSVPLCIQIEFLRCFTQTWPIVALCLGNVKVYKITHLYTMHVFWSTYLVKLRHTLLCLLMWIVIIIHMIDIWK